MGMEPSASAARVEPKLNVVFYCGSESPYGLAHLTPIIDQPGFNVVAVVFATPARWRLFRRRLAGAPARGSPSLAGFALRLIEIAGRVLQYVRGDRDVFRNVTAEAQAICRLRNVRFWFEDDVNLPVAVSRVTAQSPDLLFCAAYPQIFREPLLSVAPVGAFNSHPSLLPRCRGAHPIYWAIAVGERVSGVTTHRMTPRIDDGPIVTQLPFDIDESDDYNSVYQKAIQLVPELIDQTAMLLSRGHPLTPQDPLRVTYFREDKDVDHLISWPTQTVRQIVDKVRAANGRAFFWDGNRRVRVLKCVACPVGSVGQRGFETIAGTVLEANDGVTVMACDAPVRLLSLRGGLRPLPTFRRGQVLP